MTRNPQPLNNDPRALSFGAQSEAYAQGRPSYPVEAVRAAIPATARTAVDVGAGTGKLTQLLVREGLEVTAVEPDARMLATLRQALPAVTALEGTGEELPLPDASVDLVTYAQAWHWVDVERASREAARVLRPGGRLALLWNVRDEDDEWAARLTGIIGYSPAEAMVEAVRAGGPDAPGAPELAAPFGPLELATFGWDRPMAWEDMEAMLRSRSDFIVSTPDEQAATFRETRALFDARPEFRDIGRFTLRYRTYVFTASAPTTRVATP